jgi:hypothetical protein
MLRLITLSRDAYMRSEGLPLLQVGRHVSLTGAQIGATLLIETLQQESAAQAMATYQELSERAFTAGFKTPL